MNIKQKKQMTKELVEITTHPAFEKFIKEIDAQPAEKRLEYALKVCTIKELVKRGVPVTKDFKITPRIFEGNEVIPAFDNLAKKQKPSGDTWTLCASLGWGFCATIGKSWLAEKAISMSNQSLNLKK